MHGYRQGELYVKNNISKYDFVCVQEHWLYPCTLAEFANINDEYEYKAVSCMEDSDVMESGRPRGVLQLCGKRILSLK